jgi:uncharacterized RDD family membrane protein YckC
MQTIDIRTTQNVIIEYELATLLDRVLASIIDFVVIFIGYFIVWRIYSLIAADPQGIFLYFINPVGILLGYHFLMESLGNGQSIGKRALAIQVVRLDGEQTQLMDYLLRAVFYFLDAILTIGTLAAISIAASEKGQRFGDLAANTIVVRLKSKTDFTLASILKIESIEHYEPVYPQVKMLSEEDMLFIKSAINRYQKNPNAAHQEAIYLLCDHLARVLDLQLPANRMQFLKTLLKDYIVLTR